MATTWCPQCAAAYVEGVAECVECLVPLDGSRPLRADEVGAPDDDQLAYELDASEPPERLELTRRLQRRGIVHAWDGSTLVVRLSDEAAVDALIDDSAREAVLADLGNVVFDLDGWTPAMVDELRDALERDGIDNVFEGTEVVVHGTDEEQVDALIDLVEFPDQLPAGDEAGPGGSGYGSGDGSGDGSDEMAAPDVMSDLFVAADRLMRDPEDHHGVLSVVDAAGRAAGMAVPYGFAPALWQDVVERAAALREAIESDADDDTVIDAATSLRAMLRPLV